MPERASIQTMLQVPRSGDPSNHYGALTTHGLLS